MDTGIAGMLGDVSLFNQAWFMHTQPFPAWMKVPIY